MSIREIGCCGAYCKTCRAYTPDGICRGCKLGYADGERDINRSRCAIKLCCFRDRMLETCADCKDYPECHTVQSLHRRPGYKYGKYRQAILFIRENGYAKFLAIADAWKGPHGKYNL
jgi:hypothetical protein